MQIYDVLTHSTVTRKLEGSRTRKTVLGPDRIRLDVAGTILAGHWHGISRPGVVV